MKTSYTLFIFLFIISGLYAQTPDDGLRNAWFIPGGSARYMSIGGAMGSLGADITTANVNPAGIAFYKTKEAVITPMFLWNNNKASYLDEKASSRQSTFTYGPIGLIIGKKSTHGSWESSAFSISVNKLAQFNNKVAYNGLNNVSSYADQYVEQLENDNASFTDADNNYPLGASPAFRTLLVDTSSLFPPEKYFATSSDLFRIGESIHQYYEAISKGGITEVSFAFGGNHYDKLYLGGSVNFPIVNHTRNISYLEKDASNNSDNNFSFSQYDEKVHSTGLGVNAKLGVIYKPLESIRLGLAFHTPSVISITEKFRAAITTNTENYITPPSGDITSSTEDMNENLPIKTEYRQVTPLRAIVSGTYLFGGSENITQQRGFITADVEFVNYKGIRFYNNSEFNSDSDYYDLLNNVTKNYYKNAFNARIGGEFKYHPWTFRAGGAYYGNPYNDAQLKASRTMISGGLGYRNRGIFIDLAYTYSINKDVNFPYRLNEKINYYANVTNNRSNVILTVGFKW